MTMPEATVDEDDSLVLAEYDVWRAGKFSVMQPIAETTSVEIASHQHLRLCVTGANSRHIAAPFFLALDIHAYSI